MNQNIPGPKMRALARRLLAYEAGVCDRVTEKLRRPLSTLAGSAGFRALLGRALTLANRQAPRLSNVRVKPDGSLDGFSELDNHDAGNAGAELIAQLLGLLGAFIGEDLALSLVLDQWPDLPAFDTERSGESDHDAKE